MSVGKLGRAVLVGMVLACPQMSLVFFPAVLAICTPVPGWAGGFSGSGKGTATAGFLKLGAGARAIAMGEAYSAVADEAGALYWNPAALTRIERRSAVFMHAAHLDSSFFDYAAFGQNLGSRGAWGAGLQYFSAGGMTETDETGTELGTFTPNDLALSAGYAHEFRGYSVGLAAKYIRSKIIRSAETGAVDMGALSPAYLDGKLRLAFTVTNLGGKLRFEEEYESLPLALRLGSAYRLRDRWAASLDLGLPRDNGPFVALGTEYLFSLRDAWSLAGRAGFNSRTIGDIDGFTGMSFGLGLAYDKLMLDYAVLPLGGVGLSHRVSLGFDFCDSDYRGGAGVN